MAANDAKIITDPEYLGGVTEAASEGTCELMDKRRVITWLWFNVQRSTFNCRRGFESESKPMDVSTHARNGKS